MQIYVHACMGDTFFLEPIRPKTARHGEDVHPMESSLQTDESSPPSPKSCDPSSSRNRDLSTSMKCIMSSGENCWLINANFL